MCCQNHALILIRGDGVGTRVGGGVDRYLYGVRHAQKLALGESSYSYDETSTLIISMAYGPN
jgi:hypothetical protein